MKQLIGFAFICLISQTSLATDISNVVYKTQGASEIDVSGRSIGECEVNLASVVRTLNDTNKVIVSITDCEHEANGNAVVGKVAFF